MGVIKDFYELVKLIYNTTWPSLSIHLLYEYRYTIGNGTISNVILNDILKPNSDLSRFSIWNVSLLSPVLNHFVDLNSL